MRYYLIRNNEELGPYHLEQLKEWQAIGFVSPTDNIRNEVNNEIKSVLSAFEDQAQDQAKKELIATTTPLDEETKFDVPLITPMESPPLSPHEGASTTSQRDLSPTESLQTPETPETPETSATTEATPSSQESHTPQSKGEKNSTEDLPKSSDAPKAPMRFFRTNEEVAAGLTISAVVAASQLSKDKNQAKEKDQSKANPTPPSTRPPAPQENQSNSSKEQPSKEDLTISQSSSQVGETSSKSNEPHSMMENLNAEKMTLPAAIPLGPPAEMEPEHERSPQEFPSNEPTPYSEPTDDAEEEVYIVRKNRLIYVLLALFFGYMGAHNFYAGYTTRGVTQLLTTVLTCGAGILVTRFWSLFEMMFIKRDADGNSFAKTDMKDLEKIGSRFRP